MQRLLSEEHRRQLELDPELLMWWVHGRLDYSHMPDRRLVFEFRFSDQPQWFWILKDAPGRSVCMPDPGLGVDAMVQTDLSTMYQVWLAKLPLRSAVNDGRLALHGSPEIVRRLPAALELSPIADIVIAAAETP